MSALDLASTPWLRCSRSRLLGTEWFQRPDSGRFAKNRAGLAPARTPHGGAPSRRAAAHICAGRLAVNGRQCRRRDGAHERALTSGAAEAVLFQRKDEPVESAHSCFMSSTDPERRQMSIADHFEMVPDGRGPRAYDTRMARRQFQSSLVLIVILAAAAFALGLLVHRDRPAQEAPAALERPSMDLSHAAPRAIAWVTGSRCA